MRAASGAARAGLAALTLLQYGCVSGFSHSVHRPLIARTGAPCKLAVPHAAAWRAWEQQQSRSGSLERDRAAVQRAGVRAAAPRCSGAEEPSPGKYTLYPTRWVQLGYLSLLALLSDWVCFSVAAEPEIWQATYGHDPATLIDIFLFTNVLFCLLEPTVVRRAGLRTVIVGAAFLMSAGCLLRSGVPFTGAEPAYAQIVAGTVLVGAAQPFFQCTPPLLSATWFGSEERALSTAIAINFNQVRVRRFRCGGRWRVARPASNVEGGSGCASRAGACTWWVSDVSGGGGLRGGRWRDPVAGGRGRGAGVAASGGGTICSWSRGRWRRCGPLRARS
eukprot:2315491-Prymnesium_polylepis.1